MAAPIFARGSMRSFHCSGQKWRFPWLCTIAEGVEERGQLLSFGLGGYVSLFGRYQRRSDGRFKGEPRESGIDPCE
jgi:hypothetical protein